ncbi:MAG: hypothetical protein L3I99_05480 [Sulfurimonas sp.]|nr:hypothetical protein [Sulfurimonas sp.]
MKINHKRLRPKICQKNKKSITQGDKDYLAWLQTQDYPCFVCKKYNKIEWHHVKEYSSDKKNHKRLMPLCGEECHRNGLTLSAHGTPKRFKEIFPMSVQNDYADTIYNLYINGNY